MLLSLKLKDVNMQKADRVFMGLLDVVLSALVVVGVYMIGTSSMSLSQGFDAEISTHLVMGVVAVTLSMGMFDMIIEHMIENAPKSKNLNP